MRLLLLAALRAQTGNGTTARRIQDHLEAAGHVCVLKDVSGDGSPSAILDLIASENFQAAVGIHLYKAGRLLQGSRIPFGIVFGGTDINEDVASDEKCRVMGLALDEARFAVSFTEAMKEKAITHWPHARNKIDVQGQGIVTTPSMSLNWKTFLQSTGISQENGRPSIFLLVCGLRKVKDPLYLVEAFTEWHGKEPNVHLVIIGPAVDPDFAKEVKETVDRLDGVHLAPEIPQEDLHAVMRNCFAVVNSSASEGMSAAILEAMDLRVPVLARNIPGNAAIITHKSTGLLFSSSQECVEMAKSLMGDPVLRKAMVTRAKEYVAKHHSREQEAEAYRKLVLKLQ